MMSRTDIWLAAKFTLEQQGLGAAEHAARQISELTMQGDQEGADAWSAILAAIAVLSVPVEQMPRA